MRKALTPTTALNTRIDADLAREVHFLLHDPLTGRTRYGGLRGLVTQLLRDWVERQHGAPAETPSLIPL